MTTTVTVAALERLWFMLPLVGRPRRHVTLSCYRRFFSRWAYEFVVHDDIMPMNHQPPPAPRDTACPSYIEHLRREENKLIFLPGAKLSVISRAPLCAYHKQPDWFDRYLMTADNMSHDVISDEEIILSCFPQTTAWNHLAAWCLDSSPLRL